MKSHSVPVKDYRRKYSCSLDLAPVFLLPVDGECRAYQTSHGVLVCRNQDLPVLGGDEGLGKVFLDGRPPLGRIIPQERREALVAAEFETGVPGFERPRVVVLEEVLPLKSDQVRMRRRGVDVPEDAGRGFTQEALTPEAGAGERVGLPGMRERVAMLGGRCLVESHPGVGTRVSVAVPLEPPGAVPHPEAQ